ncbi:MAG: DNA recombination protein RmuC [Anaeromyxobacter sp.]
METLVLAGILVVAALVAYVAFAVSRRSAGALSAEASAQLAGLVTAQVTAQVTAALTPRLEAVDRAIERLERELRDELARGRAEATQTAQAQREELREALAESSRATAERLDRGRDEAGQASKALSDTVSKRLTETQALLKHELEAAGARIQQLSQSNENRLDKLRVAVDERLQKLQADNAEKLEQMRATVDEKLQGTLEKRLGESFKLVSERLEAVQRGLGEMQNLATGVGDLKKVLSNVKVRGTLGEVQLGALLDQILAPSQYAVNVATRGEGGERVEFAIRMPGQEDGSGEVYLPIDAKFPIEDHQRLVEASERGDAAAVEAASKALEVRVKGCAKDIHDKYLGPPRTTEFGILYLPVEGLFAEVVRRPGLVEALQRDQKVLVAGPTTLTAILSSLQMGFRTLAITKRSSEVWKVLGAVKTEWGKFGDVLQKVEKKLTEASNTVAEVHKRQRVIGRKLQSVEELPAAAPEQPLLFAPVDAGDPDEDGDESRRPA